jgi:hypothetical protein
MAQEEQFSTNPTAAKNSGDDIFGYMADKVKIVGDVVGPVTPLEDWECMRAAAR